MDVLNAAGGSGVIERFQVRKLSRQGWLDSWNSLLGQTWNGLVVSPHIDEFDAALRRWSIDEIDFAKPTSSACSVARRDDAQENPHGERLVLHFVDRGTGRFSAGRGDITLSPGDAVICSPSDRYSFEFLDEHQVSVVEFSRDSIVVKEEELAASMATRIPLSCSSQRILRGFVQTLWSEAGTAKEAAHLKPYKPTLLDLVSMMLSEHSRTTTQPDQPQASAVFEAMDRLIDQRLSDPDLCPTVLAQELGVSLRTLQSISSVRSTTPRLRIAAKRMERAARRLSNEPDTRVGVIGYDCGYQDSSHFSKRFHSHFGVSPVQYRDRTR